MTTPRTQLSDRTAGPSDPVGLERPRLFLPVPRRFTVVLGAVASLGVAATCLRGIPAAALIPLTALWVAGFAVGGAWIAGGRVVLTVWAAMVKALTVLLVYWTITYPHSLTGPHIWWDWVPLGALNAATGLWLLRVIRHRDR